MDKFMERPKISPTEALLYGIQTGQYPRFLYKYRSIGEYFPDIFEKSSLYFNNLPSFNDPFDGRVQVDADLPLDEKVEFIMKGGVPAKEAMIVAKNAHNSPKEWTEMVNNIVREKINSSGVCCLSKKHDDVLMWAHYCNSHTGVCLKFDLLADLEFFIVPVPVKYQNDFYRMNYMKDNRNTIAALLSTKSVEWEYEQEIRVIKPDYIGNIEFKKEALAGIYFGCRTPDKDIEDVKNLATKNGFTHLEYWRASMDGSSFRLNFDPI